MRRRPWSAAMHRRIGTWLRLANRDKAVQARRPAKYGDASPLCSPGPAHHPEATQKRRTPRPSAETVTSASHRKPCLRSTEKGGYTRGNVLVTEPGAAGPADRSADCRWRRLPDADHPAEHKRRSFDGYGHLFWATTAPASLLANALPTDFGDRRLSEGRIGGHRTGIRRMPSAFASLRCRSSKL